MGYQEEPESCLGLGSGRPEAWHALYDAHAEAIWRLVARLIGPSQPDVADVVQETFLAAARSVDKFDSTRGSPRAWLCGIARAQVALHYRRKHRHERLLTGEGRPAMERARMIDWLAGGQEEPPDVVMRAETADAVRSALCELDESHAAVLVARYLEGAEVEQMARDEGCGTVAIRSRLARARKAFRKAFLAFACVAVDIDAGEEPNV
jgi:RNA polymerase sigma-70 factor (ECF subfamily)